MVAEVAVREILGIPLIVVHEGFASPLYVESREAMSLEVELRDIFVSSVRFELKVWSAQVYISLWSHFKFETGKIDLGDNGRLVRG